MPTPKELVQELMVRDEPAFHNARVAGFFSQMEAAGYAIVPIKLSDTMRDRMGVIEDGPSRSYDDVWAEMLDAALIQS